MRLLIVTHSIDWGGSGRSLLILIRHLIQRHQISVISLEPPRADRKTAAIYAGLGAPVAVFPWGWLPVSYRGCAVPADDQDRRCEAMRDRIPELRALAAGSDALVCNGLPSASLAGLIPHLPAVLICREVMDETSARLGAVRGFLRRNIDAAVAIGPREAELPLRLGIPCEIVFNTGPESPRYRDFPPLPLRFAYFGQMIGSKGPGVLLMACAAAAGALRTAGARVDLYGGAQDGPEPPFQARMKAFVDQRGLRDVVHFHGWTEDVESAMAGCHCVVRPDATGSPWGRDVIEALSMGRPVLATGTETVFLRPGENGWLTPPEDPAAMAAILAYLSTRPDELRRAGRAGFAFARDHFDPARNLPRIEDVIRKAVKLRAQKKR